MRRVQADRASHTITLPDGRVLCEVPDEFWEYELGGKACVEHVLDGWRSRLRQPKHPYLREHFPPPTEFTPEEVEEMYDSLARACTVAVETMLIVNKLASISPLNPANHPPGWQPARAAKPTAAPPPAKPTVRPGFVQLSFFFAANETAAP